MSKATEKIIVAEQLAIYVQAHKSSELGCSRRIGISILQTQLKLRTAACVA